MASGSDLFDLLPDPILLLILNRVSDVKTLLRCRSVSRRLSSLVPLSDSLLLRVDRVIPASHDPAASLLSSLLKSLLHLISPSPPNSPSRILRRFHAIKTLKIDLPAGDLHPANGTSIKWVARFGHTLRSCVILASGTAGMKTRVVWTISALIAASARHHMAADVVDEQRLLSHLVVSDREGEGAMIMDKDGLREFRERIAAAAEDWRRSGRTTVPAVGVRMRHEPRLELSSGVVVEGATLVVVRPVEEGPRPCEAEEAHGDEALAAEAFGGGVYAEHVEKLLKSRAYILEMDSF
ncbi:F-box protein AUF2-like [Salvia miltiorrhiza]|uniref:F-box protein AUF2-like n=1 Tax=Salvia miltiorrhiza TaxID=226208 RepID=UPI0025ABA1AC|nr:F-box protein AUF2-like [Salvia miltiorrhiza]